MTRQAPDLSIVIPVKDEAQSLEPLHRELTATLAAAGRPYEVIFVDDGSTDESTSVLRRIQAADPHVRVIVFRRNFGQTAAFAAGFAQARGRLVVTADGDGQNDPRDIPALVDQLEANGDDIVCGWRRERRDAFVTRTFPSRVANAVISWATGVRLHDYGCSLKVFRAEVVKPLRLYGEMHRFLPALASEMGVRISERAVHHRPRTAGRSKYGLSRASRVILDLLTVKFLLSYSTRPLQMFGGIGLVLGAAGGVILAYLGYMRIAGYTQLANRPLVLLGILLAFSGLQLLTLGLIAELQARTYHESQNKPTYAIRAIYETDLEPQLPVPGVSSR